MAPGTRVEGSIFSEGGVHVDGEVEGDIIAKGYVIVAPGGRVRGSVVAKDVYLGGRVEGDIWSIELEIYDGGVCLGDIESMRVKEVK
ncbi:MAG: polymer-forming cytoskeletal protein [Hydrogenimonas sp.]|nr:polymer-forming cytoskeletal protein [Hydrogenimonas sp.]